MRQEGTETIPGYTIILTHCFAHELICSATTGPYRRGTAAEWRLLLPALLASCSVAAAQGWLGYTPPVIQREAAILLDRLRTGQSL